MTGHITDGVGFILNLKEHGVEGQKMVIIGTVFIEDLDNKEKRSLQRLLARAIFL